LSSKAQVQNLCALTFKFVKSEGRKARGNPDSRSAYFVIPENWTAAWIATLRASWANPRGDGQSSRTFHPVAIAKTIHIPATADKVYDPRRHQACRAIATWTD
jgi:hypothetical protein